MTSQRTGMRYAATMIVVVGLAIIASMVANAAYTRRVQEQAELRHTQQQARDQAAQDQTRRQSLAVFCSWLGVQIRPTPPPTTARGREQVAAGQQLYRQVGCHTVLPASPSASPSPTKE